MTATPRQCEVGVQLRDRTLNVTAARLRRAAQAAARYSVRKPARLSVVVVDDKTMRSLNLAYARVLGTTDVLAFDLSGGPKAPARRAVGRSGRQSGESVDGEVIVNAAVAAAEARKMRRNPEDELLLYVVHGVLHLGGYRDHTPAEKRAMRAAEAGVIASLARAAGKGRSR